MLETFFFLRAFQMWRAEMMSAKLSTKRKNREYDIDEFIRKFDKAPKFGTTSQANVTKKIEEYILKRISRPAPIIDARQTKYDRICREHFENEIKIAKEAEHGNIIQFIATKVTDSYGYILQELGTPSYDWPHHTNLRDTKFCDRFEISISDIFCAVTHDFSRGLQYLHSLNFIAADVKLKNSVIFNVGPGLQFKLIDFGRATNMSDTIGMAHPFVPPECIIKNPILNITEFTDKDRLVGNRKMDEFVLGCVLLDILMWTHHNREFSYALSYYYETDKDNFCKLKLRSIPSTNVPWLNALISTLPSQRLSMEELSKIPKETLKHDFKQLTNLPFSKDYDHFKFREDTSLICMRPLSDAY